jgi:hypothetical protein
MTDETTPVPLPEPPAPDAAAPYPDAQTLVSAAAPPLAPVPAPAWGSAPQIDPTQVGAPPYGAVPYGAPQYAAPPFLMPPDPVAEARRKQRRRNTLRWTGAVVLAAAVGAGSAFAVIQPKRTDIPGLATAADGRYVFPALTLPTLDPGQAEPGDILNNPGEKHLADIRKLLLPAPQGAVLNKSLPGTTGWLPESALVTLANPSITETFGEDGLRHTAAIGWTTPDGAGTSIYLLQFPDNADALDGGQQFANDLNNQPTGGSTTSFTLSGVRPGVSNAKPTVTYDTVTKGGKKTQYGYYISGDTEVLIVFSAPAGVSITPFEQEAQLQAELLQ